MTTPRPPFQLTLDLPMPGRGEAPRPLAREVEVATATSEPESPAPTVNLMEAICDPENIEAALRAVVRNKGAPGVDGITVRQLPDILKVRWPGIAHQLLQGRYQPQPVRRVMIPKPGGGERALGIPTVTDRVIQQAQLRLPAGTLCPASGGTGASLRRRRLSVRCRYRSGEVLRPGQSRQTHGPGGGAHPGPAGASAHPKLSDGRCADQRAVRGQPGGRPARWSALAAA